MSTDLYVLRIRLSWAKGVWREIAIRGDQTLDDLHRGILEAFEWIDEDTYRFYLSGRIGDLNSLYEPERPDQDSREIQLGELDLEEEQEFIYVFSDGDRNVFHIRVMSIDRPEPGVVYPDVVDERGESPEQELAYQDD